MTSQRAKANVDKAIVELTRLSRIYANVSLSGLQDPDHTALPPDGEVYVTEEGIVLFVPTGQQATTVKRSMESMTKSIYGSMIGGAAGDPCQACGGTGRAG